MRPAHAGEFLSECMNVTELTRALVDIESITGNERAVGEFKFLRAVEFELSLRGVGERRNLEVVFQLALVAVEDQIDALTRIAEFLKKYVPPEKCGCNIEP